MDFKPIAMAQISSAVTCDDGSVMETTTWTVGSTQAECLQKWKDSHPGKTPTKVVEVVTPKISG